MGNVSATPPLVIGCALLLSVSITQAQTIVIDDFELDEGHFTTSPSFSGSTHGEMPIVDGVDPSTADRVDTEAFQGSYSQRIFLDDDPELDEPGSVPLRAWQARLLSGGGTPANNLTLQNTATGYIGFFLKTTTPNLLASIMIDDGPALERARFLPISDDGEWHLYEWKLSDPDDWEPFAGTNPNGEINAVTITIDSIFISALKDPNIPDQDAVFYIDNVSMNPEGHIQIPEPASVILAGAAAATVIGFRRRRRL